MFVDLARVTVRAGNGGDGRLSFRREKFVTLGGPDGGDGGRGGDVLIEASPSTNTLADFRVRRLLKAENGHPGGKNRKHGKNGSALVIKVPVGTLVQDAATSTVVADLTIPGQKAVAVHGGAGGFGNAHFTSSTRQAPRIAEKGEPGEVKELTLELKMIADVGIVGLPNAGKSTLISVLSNARPEIADYPFTTTVPNLGVVDVDGSASLLLADIPGLIDGAARGKGLGDDFLRHVERTAVLIHLIDAYQPDPAAAYETVQNELKSFKTDLSGRPQIVVINKTEGLSINEINKISTKLKKLLPRATPVLAISATARSGLDELKRRTLKLVEIERARMNKAQDNIGKPQLPVYRLPNREKSWHLSKSGGHYIINGTRLERFAARTDFNNVEAVARLRVILTKNGVMHELRRQGAAAGSQVFVGRFGPIELL